MFTGKKTRDPKVVKRAAELYKEGKTYAAIIAAIKAEHGVAINTYDVELARDEYGLTKRAPLRRPRGAKMRSARAGRVRPVVAPSPVTPELEQLLRAMIAQLRALPTKLSCVLIDLDRGTYRVSVNVEHEGKL